MCDNWSEGDGTTYNIGDGQLVTTVPTEIAPRQLCCHHTVVLTSAAAGCQHAMSGVLRRYSIFRCSAR